MTQTVTRKYQTGFVRRYAALFLMIILGYLCEVCIMPYLKSPVLPPIFSM